jgi:hypothetical protein
MNLTTLKNTQAFESFISLPVHVHNMPLQFHQAIHLPQKPTYATVDLLRKKALNKQKKLSTC